MSKANASLSPYRPVNPGEIAPVEGGVTVTPGMVAAQLFQSGRVNLGYSHSLFFRGCDFCENSATVTSQLYGGEDPRPPGKGKPQRAADRKSTRLNSSHVRISYAVFCLKKKKDNYFFPYANTIECVMSSKH